MFLSFGQKRTKEVFVETFGPEINKTLVVAETHVPLLNHTHTPLHCCSLQNTPVVVVIDFLLDTILVVSHNAQSVNYYWHIEHKQLTEC